MKKSTYVLLTTLILSVAALISGCASDPYAARRNENSEATALKNLGEAHLAQGNYTTALRHFLDAERVDPENYLIQYDLGLTYIEKKLYDKAILHLQKAVKLKPDYSVAINSLGNAYILKEDYDKAITVLRELIENEAYAIYPTPHYPRSNLGWAYYHKQEYHLAEQSFMEALQFYEDGLRKDMTYLSILRGLGLTYLALSRPDDAITNIKKAIDMAPRVQELYMDLAMAYQAKGDREEATRFYQKVIQLDPGNKLASEAREKVHSMQP